MPLFILILGIVLVITGLNNRLVGPADPNLTDLLGNDFSPKGGSSFLTWALAIAFIGMIGYARPLRTVSNLFLGLLFLAIFLAGPRENSQGAGFFANLLAAFQFGKEPSNTANASTDKGGIGSIVSGFTSHVLGSEINSIQDGAANLLSGSI